MSSHLLLLLKRQVLDIIMLLSVVGALKKYTKATDFNIKPFHYDSNAQKWVGVTACSNKRGLDVCLCFLQIPTKRSPCRLRY